MDASEGQPLAVARFRGFWAMRLDRLDAETPGRIWRTEASIGHNVDSAAVGVRLTVIDTAKSVKIPTSVPRVVCDLIESPGIVEYDFRLTASSNDVLSQEETEALVQLLVDRRRNRPVVVVSATSGASNEELEEMASRLAGLGHVFRIHDQAMEWLKARLGNEFSVPQRGLRTFNPKFDPELDEFSAHPPATLEWITRRFGGLRNFVWMLVDRFARMTVASQSADTAMPSVDQVRALAVEDRLATLARQGQRSEREKLLEEQNALLEKSVKEKTQEYDYAALCVRDAEEERDRFRAQLAAIHQRVVVLEGKLGDIGVEVDIPDDFEHLNNWVLENFPGRIQILPRAFRAAKKSTYEDKPLVYQCLAKLGREYVDARREGLPIDGIFEPLGVQLERTGSRSHLAQWEEEYFFTHHKQSEFLEWHIKKGSGHNEITTLRIYFFYDEEDGMVIVGHLTGHLTNAMT